MTEKIDTKRPSKNPRIPFGLSNVLSPRYLDTFLLNKNPLPHLLVPDDDLKKKEEFPCGSCSSSNKDKLYEDSEEHEAQKLIVSGVDRAAAQNVAHKKIIHRRAVDEQYEKQDKEGREGIGAAFSLTSDGDVYFPEFDGSLRELFEKQMDLRPHEYNRKEHETVLAAYKSLREGNRQSAHIVHHYNEQGELEIRDVVILTYDPVTNFGQMHVINISENGNVHNAIDSAREAMEKRLSGFAYQGEKDGVFVFTRNDEPVDPTVLFRERPASGFQETLRVKKSIIADEYDKKDRYGPFVRHALHGDKKETPIPFILPEFLQRLMGRDKNGLLVQKNEYKGVKQATPLIEKADKKTIKEILLKKQKKDSELRKISLVFIEKTGIGMGASILLLKQTTEQPIIRFTKKEKHLMKKELRKMRMEEKIRKRSREKKKYMVEKRNKMIFSKEMKSKKKSSEKKLVFHTLERYTRREKRYLRKTEKIERKQILVFQKEKGLYELIQLFRKITHKQEKLRKKQEKRVNVKKKEIMKHDNNEKMQRASKETLNHRNHEKIRKIKESVIKFSQAVILYMLFAHMERTTNEESNKIGKSYLGEEFNKNEQLVRPWILFSIIWHMDMVREAGFPTKVQKSKKKRIGKKTKIRGKRRKNRPIRLMPEFGVIYAYPTL